MIVGYVRISSDSQSTDRQELPDAERIFEETESGAKRDRPQLQLMLDFIREGDVVQVHELSRLARSLRDLQEIVEVILTKGCTVSFLSENLTFKPDSEDIFATFQMQVLGAFAEMERKLTRKRQSEGIRKAKEAGRYKGRKATIDPNKIADLQNKGLTADQIAKSLGISRASVYRYLGQQGMEKGGKG
jgi:DNA invertase Pin-like site-specific DNA recombinase